MIEQIKQKLTLAPFVAPHSNGLKSSGRGFFIGKCPFCKKDEVFWVADHLGLCGCFRPTCVAHSDQRIDPNSKPMDIINFYARLNSKTNDEAVSDLAIMAGLK